MALYCNTAILTALAGLAFPATKQEALHQAETVDAPEAVLVALNSLPDQVRFSDLDGVCENVSIACSLEVYRALEGLHFPATGQQIVDYAARQQAGDLARQALGELARSYSFNSIEDVCRKVVA